MSALVDRVRRAVPGRAAPAPPPAEPAAADRAPDWVADGTPAGLRTELESLIGGDGVLSSALDLVRYASDASPYRRIPEAVAVPRDVDGVVQLLRFAARTGRPLTFRAAGTSLNGQAGTDSILVDVRRHFSSARVLDGGERVRVGPGIVLGHVNRLLRRHGRKLGPDPASTDTGADARQRPRDAALFRERARRHL